MSTVYLTLRNPFYCGVYEYPRGTGNWYTGKHTALITRELYQLVQEKLVADHKPKTRNHIFTFTKLMTCGECGSGITGVEKSKIIKEDGSTRWYIYYTCTKSKGNPCSNPYIREDHLIQQLAGIIDTVDIDEIGAQQSIEREVSRYNKLQAATRNPKDKIKADEMDIRRYAKYLLENGSLEEKRELLGHLRKRIVMKDKKITLE